MRVRLAHLSLAALLGQPSSGSHTFDPNVPGALSPDRLPANSSREFSEEPDVEGLVHVRKSRTRTQTRTLVDHFIGELDVLDAKTPPSGVRHPFWHFEGHQLRRFQVYICCVVLFVAGVLCSAGGIGGGGIYVTVLMVAGSMKVADAVPLSKSVVFFGSISSLILNMRKSGPAKTLIDYNICRLVVPSSLLGTFLGVFLNRHLPTWLILLVLVAVLLFISVSVTSKTWSQYQEENATSAPAAAPQAPSSPQDEENAGAGGGSGRPSQTPAAPPPPASPTKAKGSISGPGADSEGAEAEPTAAATSMRSVLSATDMIISLCMLTIVIVFGMLRFHAGECMRAEKPLQEEACNHPAYFWLGHGTLQRWMSSERGSHVVRGFSFVFPLLVCATVLSYYTTLLVSYESWRLSETLKYSIMAVCTGCLAGLVGIGGGLIFSPFFLIMGVEPSIAVASSSTCVIFTSSSTTMQYLLTDRIIISLTIVYGVINLVASYVGTSLVHMLQDKCSARKSYISFIVLLGVVISTVLSIIKLVSKLKSEFGPGHAEHVGAH